MTKRAFKLLRLRADGTLGSLLINRCAVIPEGIWLLAEDHKTKGYKHRPGWHTTPKPEAPHLSKKKRIWCVVEIRNYTEETRPLHQGRLWYLAQEMKVIGRLDAKLPNTN